MTNNWRFCYTRTRINIETIEIQDLLVVLPLLKVLQVVVPKNYHEFLVWVQFCKHGQGVYGVAWLGQVEFNVGDLELVIASDGRFDHIIAVKLVKEALGWLKRILRRHNKPHLLKVGMLSHNICDDKVPAVDGIKRSKEKSNLLYRGLQRLCG